MAIGASHLITEFSLTDTNAYTTSSISPSSNALVLALVTGRVAPGGPGNSPTLSGNGLTWVEVTNVIFDTITSLRVRLVLYRAMGASPSSGGVTITWGGTIQQCAWSIVEFTGVDTSGTDGSGAVVQSATNRSDSAGSLSVTLGSFGSANNATYGGFRIQGTEGMSPGSGFTEFGEAQGSGTGSDAGAIASEYQLANDTSVDYSWTTTTLRAGGIAAEIKAAVAVAIPPPFLRGSAGQSMRLRR